MKNYLKNVIKFKGKMVALSLLIVFVVGGVFVYDDVFEKKDSSSHQKINISEEKVLESQDVSVKNIELLSISEDIDTSDWLEYTSDVYRYSFSAPKYFVFRDEYTGDDVKFNPNGKSFILSNKLRDKNSSFDMSFGIIPLENPDGINEFIERNIRETGLEDDIKKLLSKNGIDYYTRRYTKYRDIPKLIHYDNLIISFSFGKSFDEKMMIKVIDLFVFE